jgi:hypothetical protein
MVTVSCQFFGPWRLPAEFKGGLKALFPGGRRADKSRRFSSYDHPNEPSRLYAGSWSWSRQHDPGPSLQRRFSVVNHPAWSARQTFTLFAMEQAGRTNKVGSATTKKGLLAKVRQVVFGRCLIDHQRRVSWQLAVIIVTSVLLPIQPHSSRLQTPFFEFLRCRAELAQLVNGRARGREGERLKRFSEHLVEVFP